MTPKQVKQTLGAAAVCAAIILTGVSLSSSRVRADDDSESKVRKGFEIAPVPLNLVGKNRERVGLGSYIVNALADCNGCHSAGPATEFAPGFNPYLIGQTTKINPATYLGGGRDFGQVPPVVGPHIISRNLTPDKTGRAEGGASLEEFTEILRHGTDFDHVHPPCGNNPPNGTCMPAPFDGTKLQVMPWFAHMNMTDHDIEAIYEYLSSIPCIAGPASGELHHDCH